MPHTAWSTIQMLISYTLQETATHTSLPSKSQSSIKMESHLDRNSFTSLVLKSGWYFIGVGFGWICKKTAGCRICWSHSPVTHKQVYVLLCSFLSDQYVTHTLMSTMMAVISLWMSSVTQRYSVVSLVSESDVCHVHSTNMLKAYVLLITTAGYQQHKFNNTTYINVYFNA